MNWPLVWRETYEAEQARANRLAEDCGRLYQQNLSLNATLLIREMRNEPVRLVEKGAIVASAPRVPSPMDKRIDEVSEGDPRVKRHFWGMVSRMRKEGKSDGDILGEIRWQTTESE